MAELQDILVGLFNGAESGAPIDGSALALVLKSVLATIIGVVTLVVNSEHPFIASFAIITVSWLLWRVVKMILIGTAIVILLLVLAQLFALS
ncbi:MAG: hypothetical protein ABIJ61_09545 [bacterium]